MKDHYTTLGVDRKASAEDIKKAYRKLSMKYHPDHNHDDAEAEAKFKEVNEAHSVLSNQQKRQEYDNPNPFGDMFGGGPGGFPGGFPGGGFGFERRQPQKPDLNAPRDGKFIVMEVEIPLSLFLFGGNYKATLSYHEGCSDCDGKGFDKGTECDVCNGMGYVQHVENMPGFTTHATRPCNKCNGLGQIPTEQCQSCKGSGNVYVENKEIIFDIPQGPPIGSRFVASGKGRVGLNGGRNGDVGIIVSNVKRPDLNKLTPKQVEQLENLLGVLDNVS